MKREDTMHTREKMAKTIRTKGSKHGESGRKRKKIEFVSKKTQNELSQK
jgi:hypothetical protein